MTRYRTFTIGRADDNDLVISRERVSRLQAELVVAVDGSAFLTNRSSQKTTKIRDKPKSDWREVRQEPVSPGQVLRFADFEITVERLLSFIDVSAAPPPKQPPKQPSKQPSKQQPPPDGIRFIRRDPVGGQVIKS